MKDFGDYAIIIKDVEEFLTRIRVAHKMICEEDNANYWMAYKRVKYNIDLSQPFKYNEFQKSKRYLWQNEFRIAMDFSLGKFSSKLTITDFAKLTFQGDIETDANPRSIEDWIYFDIGDIRDICECIETDTLIDGENFQLSINKTPKVISPFETHPRQKKATFYKEVAAIPSDDGHFVLGIACKCVGSAWL